MKELYNKGDLILNEDIMKKIRSHLSPEKMLSMAGVVDQNDHILTRQIQMLQQSRMQEDLTEVQASLL
jgi:hypothetical protein